MSTASRYWHWIKLSVTGKRLVEPIPEAQTWMQQQFHSLDSPDLTDPLIQPRLLAFIRSTVEDEDQRLAECCLRCFISDRIDWACRDLAAHFGEKGQFSAADLLPLVLDDTEVVKFRSRRAPADVRSIPPSTYQSIATKALQTFDPERSQLSTWVKRLVTSSPAVTAFLAERGLYLQSQWSLLNSKTPAFLERRLNLADDQLRFFTALLESYLAVYRRDWLTMKASKGKCPSPTSDQLQEISAKLESQLGQRLPPAEILDQLGQLADRIREASHPRPVALEPEEYQALIDRQPAPTAAEDDDQNEFLGRYRQQFQVALNQAIEQTVCQRFRYFQKRDPAEAQKFLQGLSLFHCYAIAMTKLKDYLQKEQYQITRLLQLLKLREDVKRNMLNGLRNQVQELAAQYVGLAQLEALMEKIDAALEAEIDRVMEEARVEASTGKRDREKPRSRFSASLCRYLDQCPDFHTRSLP